MAKKEYCEFLDSAIKDRVFGFDLQTGEKHNTGKKKLFSYFEVHLSYKKPTEFAQDFWAMMANGEAWALSFDGVVLILIDTFKFLQDWDLVEVSSIRETLKEIKSTLQNMLYTVILTADKYQGCHLQALIHVLTVCYKNCPIDQATTTPIEANFKLTLDKLVEIPELSLDAKWYQDPALREVFEKLRIKDIVEDYAYKTLTPDVVSNFVGECFIRHFIENGLQIFDLQTFFDSSQYFDICLKLRDIFQQFGFAFRHAMTFIEEVVYRSDETVKSEVQIQKITKKIAELVQSGKPQGRKIALREEKKRRMDVRFQYVDEKDKIPKDSLSVFSLQDDEFGVNAEAIFIEFKKAKRFIFEATDIVMKSPYERLIDTYRNLTSEKQINFRTSELAAYFSVQFMKRDDDTESRFLRRLTYFNQIIQALEKKGDLDEISNFIRLLEKAHIDQTIFEKLGQSRSLHQEVEIFNFLIHCMTFYQTSFKRIAEHFLMKGDMLFHISKQIFGKRSLEALGNTVAQLSNNNLFIQLGLKYLDFITLFFQQLEDTEFTDEFTSKIDKMSFHLFRRFGEYLNALQTFFKDNSNHLYVSLSNSRSSNYVAKSLVAFSFS